MRWRAFHSPRRHAGRPPCGLVAASVDRALVPGRRSSFLQPASSCPFLEQGRPGEEGRRARAGGLGLKRAEQGHKRRKKKEKFFHRGGGRVAVTMPPRWNPATDDVDCWLATTWRPWRGTSEPEDHGMPAGRACCCELRAARRTPRGGDGEGDSEGEGEAC